MAAVDIVIVILAGLIPITAASLYSLIGRATSTADTSQPARKRPDAEESTIPEQGVAAADETRRDAQAATAEDDRPTEQEQPPSEEPASGLDSLTAVTIHHSEVPSATPEPETAR